MRTKRSPVLRRGFGESRSVSGFPPMMALVRCLFAHPSASGAQPTHKSLFYDAFLRRPAPQSRSAPRGSVETTVVARRLEAGCPGVRYHAVDCSPPLPGCRLSVGSPKPWRPRCPLAEGLIGSRSGLPTLLAPKRRSGVRRIQVRAIESTPTSPGRKTS